MTFCINCKNENLITICDLGDQPLANSYIKKDEKLNKESYYPLRLSICKKCNLVQSPSIVLPKDIFNNYAYFSSFSKSWLKHAYKYFLNIPKKLKIDQKSNILEVACNDGYLLQYFKKKGYNCVGVEPAKNVAKECKKKNIRVYENFFSLSFVKKVFQSQKFDLLVGNNVLAHTPKLNDFVKSIEYVLKDEGVATLEFPHFKKLYEGLQFDTVYHEHFSYFSLKVIKEVFKQNNLKIFEVEELDTHGGSLRIYACKNKNKRLEHSVVNKIISQEEKIGLFDHNKLNVFSKKIEIIKCDCLKFLNKQKKSYKTLYAYGAAAKGNTFLNYCGIKNDLIQGVFDLNPEKHGKYLPGSHIPVLNPKDIKKLKPDFLIILPWNIKDEIMKKYKIIKNWNGRFVTFIPKLKVEN